MVYVTLPGEVPVLSNWSFIITPVPEAVIPVIVPPVGVEVIEAVHSNVAPVVADVII